MLQVLLNKDHAVGVEALTDSKTRLFKARREIILSAGAIGTPPILQLSGIGPKEHLNKMKVTCLFVKDTLA